MKRNDLGSRLRSIRIALGGLKQVLVLEPNARIHGLITLIVFGAAWLLQLSRVEWVLLVITVGLVWMAEVFNTAVEKLVDLASPERNPAAKAVKDISAGAVLVSALVSILVGLLLFGPRLWLWIAGWGIFTR